MMVLSMYTFLRFRKWREALTNFFRSTGVSIKAILTSFKHSFIAYNYSFTFLSKAIDIIVGGPPCQDYTGINANAQGPTGAQGQFLPRFAEFIQNVQARQPEHPVYYLIENVVFIDGSRVDNYNLIQNILTGVVETKIEALYFSPCKRYRSYWTNFPFENSEHGYEQAVEIHPDSCLEEGWIFPVEDEVECVKVNTFLASKGRIKDARMEKYKPLGNNKHEKAYFSALERERMLGFPDNYVKDAGR